VLDKILLALQAFQVLFLLIHDWIPLGRLNDVAAVRSQDTLGRLVRVTAIQTIPFAIGLYFSARYFGAGYPHWLVMWLWISYALLFIGQLRAWWVPYLLKPEASGALSNHVWQYPLISATAKWDGAKHRAHSSPCRHSR
jgi:hypothetical protein